MKYFTFSEVLFTVPVSIIFGGVFAFLYRLLISVFACISVTVKFKDYAKARLKKQSFRLNFKSYNELNKTKYAFIISEIVGFLFVIFFGISFSILLYILTDGIPRLYILLFVIASFVLSMKLLNRFLSWISFLISKILFGILFRLLYAFIYIPVKIYLSVLKRYKMWRKKRQKSLSSLDKSIEK